MTTANESIEGQTSPGSSNSPAPVAYHTPDAPAPQMANRLAGDGWLGVKQEVWIQLSILAALFALTFWPNLRRLWEKTNPIYGEPNWGHSICVPLIGLYYLWINRDELLARVVRPELPGRFGGKPLWGSLAVMVLGGVVWATAAAGMTSGALITVGQGFVGIGLITGLLGWGLGLSIFGLVAYAYGIYPGQNDYLKDLGMVVTLFGVVLMLFGWDVMRTAAFPVLFLIVALPWPPLLYSKVALPLQELAATAAVGTLNLTGVASFQDGSKIFVGDGPSARTLNVAEACAGMRSLMTFIAVGGAVAFLSSRPLWQKIVMTASAVPIAILANVTRVSGQAQLDRIDPRLSENFAHAFVGLVMLVPAFFLILLVGWVLDMMFVDEVDEAELAAKSAQAAAVLRRRAGGGERAKATPAVATASEVQRPGEAAAVPPPIRQPVAVPPPARR